jgi:NAD(P)-dependent dehydrogenase (short-subunit alcohol dehydrogenase family)
MESFTGKVAVVTGAASGMGRAFAQRFAEAGMKLVIADVDEAGLKTAASELRAEGHEVLSVPTDVSKLRALERLARETISRYGSVHLVCNNAGVEGYLDGAIWEATAKDWTWTFGVNFWSVVYGVRTFIPLLLANEDGGHVVNTCSMTSVVTARNMYGIAKHALLALTEVLDADLRERGAKVRVTALCPGIVATRLFQGSRNRPADLQNAVPAPGADAGRELRARMHERLAEGMPPSEVAEILFEAIREERLYVLTDHDWDAQIVARNEEILSPRARGAEPG